MDITALIFPNITALDIIGPYEVLSRLPDARVRFVAPKAGQVATDNGFLRLVADHAIDDITDTDVLLVPGGYGTRPLERDPKVLAWVRDLHAKARWTASVCTGSLILAAAGLLDGIEATTHWSAFDRLEGYGALPTEDRVVFADDRRIVTAAGVSSGIDMALQLAARLTAPQMAQAIQLGIEYDPQPPFQCGSTKTAPPTLVALVRAYMTHDETTSLQRETT